MLDLIVNPFITVLLFLYRMLGGNVVLAIVVFTILVRLVTYPLTLKQQRSTKAMQELQPELKKLQEKFKNDREKMAAAQWELYREYGVNPLAGCLPLVIQFPILIGLYRAIVATLAATPLQLLDLSGRVWVQDLFRQVPLHNRFLWLNLAVPDPLYILPILVVVTTWLSQKLVMPSTPSARSGDKSSDQAAQLSRQMMLIMPLMFGFFSLSFASGLSIYFIASNLIGIGQYGMMGRVDVRRLLGRKSSVSAAPASPDRADRAEKVIEKVETGKAGPRARAARPALVDKPKRSSLPADPVIKPKRAGISDSRADRAKAKR
jgi:YidC/Oxa1 family membrane protein insertase